MEDLVVILASQVTGNTYSKTGGAASAGAVSGTKSVTLGKQNIAISAGVASGASHLAVSQKVGSMISALVASATDAITHSRTGISISTGVASGASAKGVTYFVKNGGSDAADGLSDATAWATVAKVQGATLLPGDTVQFKCGSVWREAWNVGAGGSNSAYINYTSYSSGAKPRITGTVVKSGFALHSGSIYKITGYACPIDTYLVTQNGARLLRKTSTGAMVAGSFFHDDAGDILYVWMTDNSNPSTKTIEVSEQYNEVVVAARAYVTFNGIKFDGAGGQFGASYKVMSGSDHIDTLFCDIVDAHYAGYWFERAASQTVSTSVRLLNCNLGNCTIQNIAVEGSGTTNRVAGWIGDGNIVDGGGNSSEGQASVAIRYGSAAAWTNNEVKNFTGAFFWGGAFYNDFSINSVVQGNYHHDCTPNAVQFDDGSNGFYCIRNTFVGMSTGDCAVFEDHLRANGTSTFVHNTCVGGQSGLRFGPGSGASKETGITFKNNIVSHQTFANINIDESGSSAVASDDFDNDVDYNLYYKSGGAVFVTFDANNTYNLTTWRAATTWDAHSVEGDPLFTNAGAADYTLQSGSPALNVGVAISPINDGYSGAGPDMGRYERTAGNVFTKVGSAISAAVASGAKVITRSKTGSGITAGVTSGADVSTHSETGTAISALSAAGARVREFAGKAGSAISALVASGGDVHEAVESGSMISAGVASGADQVTHAETGLAVSVGVASGADQSEHAETGTAVTAGVTSGADATTHAETGAGISAGVASGADVAEHGETGVAISAGVASGQAVKLAPGKAGIAASEGKASGADASEHARTGLAVSSLSSAGADSHTAPRTGMVIATAVFLGPDATTRQKANIVVSSAILSGPDVTTHVESGLATSEGTMAGVHSASRAVTGIAAMGGLGASGSYRTVIVADAPVSYWRLNETASPAVDEMGVQDGSYGGGLGMTLGAPGLLTGDSNKATVFGGIEGVTIGNNAPFQIGTGTLEAWIKTPDAGAGYRAIICKANAYGMFMINNELGTWSWGGLGAGPRLTGVFLNDNIRHFVEIVFQDGVTNGSQFYVDGVAVGAPFTMDVNGQGDNLCIGTNSSAGGQIFNGTIDEPAVYSYKLTPDKSLLHYQAGAGLTATSGGALSGTRITERAKTGIAVAASIASGVKQKVSTRSGIATSATSMSGFRNVILNRSGMAVIGTIVSGVVEFIRTFRGGTLDLEHDTAHIVQTEHAAVIDMLHISATIEMHEEVRK